MNADAQPIPAPRITGPWCDFDSAAAVRHFIEPFVGELRIYCGGRPAVARYVLDPDGTGRVEVAPIAALDADRPEGSDGE